MKYLSLALDYHYVEDYKEDDWDPSRSWLVRGRLGDISFLRRLESLEVPLPMLLGWDPADAPYLHEVLPRNLLHLGLRDDLLDWNREYHWTSWNSAVIGSLLDSSFHNTVDAGPVLSQLEKLGTSSETGLRTVTLLMSHGRFWPGKWLLVFSQIFRNTRMGMDEIQAKVLLRMGGESDEDNRDLVREITFSKDGYSHEQGESTCSVRYERLVTSVGGARHYQESLPNMVKSVTYWSDEDDYNKRHKLSFDIKEVRHPLRVFEGHV